MTASRAARFRRRHDDLFLMRTPGMPRAPGCSPGRLASADDLPYGRLAEVVSDAPRA